MRLTLRTMLAYMDDILEPADRAEIGQKIEESEFARGLSQRIHDVTRRVRLGAPKVSGKGMGLDPNTVAEYLDNTLAGERVPDFEKVCLESDVHLAEVTSCHQILTMVLGQPAEVDPAIKRRMYRVLEDGKSPAPVASKPAVTGATDAAADDTSPMPARQKPEVPAYLREGAGRSKGWSIVAALVLLVLLAGAITLALGPLDHTNPVAKLLGIGQPAQPEVVVNNGGAKDPGNVPADSNAVPPPVDNGKMPPANNVVPPPGDAPTDPAAVPPVLVQPGDAGNLPPVDPGAVPAVNPPVEPVVNPENNPPANNPPANPAGTVVPMPGDPNIAAPVPPLPMPGDAVPPVNTLPPSNTAPSDPNAPAAVNPALPGAPDPAAPELPGASDTVPGAMAVGRFLPDRKGIVLLRLDTQGNWARVPAGDSLNSGDKLLVLPTYRPTISLSAGLTLHVPPETMLELLPADAEGTPGVRIYFGRLVASTIGRPGTKLKLDLGVVSGEATFTDAQATLGVEVRRYHTPGSDPESQDARIAADLYAESGQIVWTTAGGMGETIIAPKRVVLATHPADATDTGTLPPWLVAEQLSPIDARASESLAQAMEDDKRPVGLVLREQAEHRRAENRSLAAQCLAMADEFEPFIAVLNDQDQRAVWPVQIESVKASLGRGPATAAKVREALQTKKGVEPGKQLYRMLWGYTKDDLQNGEAQKLVDALDNESLDFRVLAFANLRDITGATFQYRPEAPVAMRQQAVRRWQEHLRMGMVTPREPGAKTPTAPADPVVPQPTVIPMPAPLPATIPPGGAPPSTVPGTPQ